MKTYLTEGKKQKIITEKWSISDKIDDGINIILNTILKDYSTHAECYKLDDGLWFYKNEDIPIEIFDINTKLTYFYYFTNDAKICDFVYNNASSLNGFDEKNNTLYITLYSINGEIQTDYSIKNLVHETEHLLQIHYGLKNNINYKKLTSDAYDFATSKIYNEKFNNFAEKVIAFLIYYSDSHEQDAFVNEYYKEIISNIGVLYNNTAEINRINELYQYYIDCFHSNIDKNIDYLNALNEYKQFGYNQTNFCIMLKKQKHRLEKKINNVKKHFKHISEYNKQGVRLSPSNNIPMHLILD